MLVLERIHERLLPWVILLRLVQVHLIPVGASAQGAERPSLAASFILHGEEPIISVTLVCETFVAGFISIVILNTCHL